MKSTCIIIISILININILLAQSDNKDVFNGCATDELMLKNPVLRQLQNAIDDKAYKYFAGSVLNNTKAIVYIPVVVHIIHNGGPENISDAQVQTAIANINAKFAQSNGYQIQFCLAQRDPQGNATNGITRNISALTTETMEVDDIALKDINRWNPHCYLNIWVIKEILSASMGSGVIGYAYLPSAHGLNMDGVVLEANYFGSSTANDGVGTHEIGHYLGLYHTFQNGCANIDCLKDGDQVCDTPPDQTTFASCSPPTNSCNTDADDKSVNNPFKTDVADLSDDYMDYSNLNCYTQFTEGQYNRMQYFLTNVRNSLLNCLSCTTPCPTPLTAKITVPLPPINISTGTAVNFAGTVTNSGNYQWYINSGTIISTSLSASYTFNNRGSYWVKFRAISNNPTLCSDAIDSILVIVTEPVVSSCKGSLQFDNYNDAVRLPNNNQYYSSNGFTWECWFKLTTSFGSQLRSLIHSIDNVAYQDISLGFGWNGGIGNVPINHLAFKVDGLNGPNANTCDYAPAGGFILGNWYHAAGVMDYATHTAKLYLNGQLVDTKSVNSTPFTRIIPTELSYDENNSKIGYHWPPLGGNMDEIRIWNCVRTTAEIAANYNQCLTGNEANLLVYYRCNQTAGSTATDATANGNNGILTNTAAWSNQEPLMTGTNCSSNNVVDVNSATICSGSSAILNVTGATSYSWSPATGLSGTTGATVTAAPTITTTYTVTGTNSCGANTAVSVVVVKNPSLNNLDLGNDITMCSSGTHIFDAGPDFMEYLWNDGSINRTYTAYGTGKYWVTVKDSCGNIQSDTVLITLSPSPTLDLGNDISLCNGDSTLLTYTTNGIYKTFQWTPLAGLSCVDCSNPFTKPLTSIKYYLVASTEQGCANIDSVNIIVDSLPVITTTGDKICDGISATISASGGVMYTWNAGTGQSLTVSPVITTTYYVTGVGINGCFNTAIAVVYVNSINGITSADKNLNFIDVPFQFNWNGINGNTYEWDFGDSTAHSYIKNPSHSYSRSGKYTVKVIITSADGCIAEFTLFVEVIESTKLELYNIFTPNGDGKNDIFRVRYEGEFESFNMKIFNRWGILMFETSNIDKGWDGKQWTKNGFSDGTYYYIISAKGKDGKEYNFHGALTLFK